MSTRNDLPECIDAIFDCNSTIATCRNSKGFDFVSLWTVTQQYFEQCGSGPWLFEQSETSQPLSVSTIALKNNVCKQIAGAGFTKYPGADIWQRLTTWKFPLFQLVANSPRPPLGFWVEAFTFTHFLGDPVGTIVDVVRKIEGCQDRALFWQHHLPRLWRHRLGDDLASVRTEMLGSDREEYLWKSLALIVDSFDEWGIAVGDKAEDCLLANLDWLCSPTQEGEEIGKVRRGYLEACLTAADSLAADRSTKFVPVVIAQTFFVGSVVIAMIRTEAASSGPNPSVFVDVEMYSIAFTAQFFWVIFIVMCKSMIGTSQSINVIPRTLKQLQKSLGRIVAEHNMLVNLPVDELSGELGEELRKYNGGIYSWQPARGWAEKAHHKVLAHRTRVPLSRHSNSARCVWLMTRCLPFIVVAGAAITGQMVSAFVPPAGWSCRSNGMMWMVIVWMASYAVSLLPANGRYRLWFWVTMAKDVLAIGVTFGIVMGTQFGMYNRCDCFSNHGRVGTQLPLAPVNRGVLETRLHSTYPAIVAAGLILQLILAPGFLMWRFQAAVRVFLQRDDGTSNMTLWYDFQQRRRAGNI